MNWLKLSIDFTGVVFEVVITRLMFSSLMRGRRIGKLLANVLSAGVVVIMTAATCVENNVYVLPAVIFLSGFAISMMYQGKWRMRLFLSVLLLILFTLSEMLVGALLVFFAYVDMVDIRETAPLYMVGLLASNLLVFLLVKIIGYKRLDIYRHMNIRTFLALLITPVSSAVAMYVMATHIENYRSTGSMVILLCASSFLIISNVFVFYMYERQLKSEYESMKFSFIEKQMDLQAAYYKEFSERQTEIQKLSHDMKNSLIGVLGLLERNDYDAAMKQLRKLSGAVHENTGHFHTGYPAIDALLTSKYQAAQEKRIPMEAHITLPPEMRMDVLDLCILLGNALDNALEASAKIAEEEKRFIRLNISTFDKYLSVRLINATVDEESENYSTTKSDRRLHGFGLEGIRAIAAQHDGSVGITHKQNVFSLTVLAKYG